MNILFVVGMHKSGTSLLRDVLTAMPGIAGTRFELHPYEAAGARVSYPLRRRPSTAVENRESGFANLRCEAKRAHETADPYGGGTPTASDIEKLGSIEGWRDGPWPDDDDERIAALLTAAAAAFSEPGDAWFVEKSVESGQFVAGQLRLMPESRAVRIVRHPAAVLFALRRFHRLHGSKKRHVQVALRAVSIATSWWSFSDRATECIPDHQLLTIRYEDLVSEPLTTLIGVGHHLQIPELSNESALSDALSSVETDNSTGREKLMGLSKTRSERWRVEASLFELTAAYAILRINRNGPYSRTDIRLAIRQRIQAHRLLPRSITGLRSKNESVPRTKVGTP